MELQKLYSKIRQAIDDYDMIEAGDKIAVGISGGKDSLTLLYGLCGLRKFYPKSFDVVALTVDVGSGDMDFSPIRDLCRELKVEYEVIQTDIFAIVQEKSKAGHPCYMCARLRKGTMNERALALGCNKIAYAHHKDDVIETFMMSLLLEGRVHTFSPVTNWEKNALTLIRPMIYVSEAAIRGIEKRYQLPVVKNTCPVDGETKRAYAKQLIKNLNADIPKSKDRIFAAIQRANIDGWHKKSL